jgi:1,4-alpha-glucan branching enzyme
VRNRKPGTFADAVARLDHLVALGVNHIAVMPAAEFPGDYSWGYNPSDPYAVESAYGGPTAFKALINTCHRRGVAVSLDVIYNHWGPGDLDLWRFDGWYENGHGGIYFYNDGRGQTAWGSRPDYGRPEVRAFILDNAVMWVRDNHLDGLRWDSTIAMRNARAYNNNAEHDLADGWSLLQEGNVALDALGPDVLSLAEDMQQNEWLTKPVGEGGAGFDAQWDSGFVHPVRAALETPWDHERDMWAVQRALAGAYNGDPFQRVIFTESHDEVANGRQRVTSSIEHTNAAGYWARKRSTLGAALLFTAPGIPMLFQGQEILEDGWFTDGDPLDWSRTNSFAGILRLYTDLIALRRNTTSLSRGLTGRHLHTHHVNDAAKLVAYHRWDEGGPGDDVVVVANFANCTWAEHDGYRLGFPRAGRWHVRLNSDLTRYSADYGNVGADQVIETEARPYDNMPVSATIVVAPYSALVLSQDAEPPAPSPPSGLRAVE